MKFPKFKKIRKRIAASAVAAVTTVSVLLGGSFDSPADILSSGNTVAPVVVSDSLEIDGPDETINDEGTLPGEEKRKGIRARVRAAVKRLPLMLRAGVALPMWFLGWLLLGALGFLWEPLLSPLLSSLLSALCVAAILAATLITTVKAVFPDMPIKKILNRKNLFTLCFGALVFGASGALMQIFIPQADRLSDIVEGVIMLAVLSFAAIPLLKAEMKRRREAEKETPLSPADEKKMIRELAESVSR